MEGLTWCYKYFLGSILNSQFSKFEVWTVSRPTWKLLDAMVNASFSRCSVTEQHSSTTGVFHNFQNSKMQFFRHLEVAILFCLSFLNE